MPAAVLPWVLYTEPVVGRNHPSLVDVDNRPLRTMLSSSGYSVDGNFPGLYGPVFNVKAFGALGDFGTDDTAAIAATVAAAQAAGGGIVFFPRGGFVTTTGNVFNAITDVIFQGAGANASQIIMGASGINPLGFTGVCSRITVRDLWVGSTVSRAAGVGLSIIGTAGIHSDTFLVENVTLQNLPTPTSLQYVDSVIGRNIRVVQSLSGAAKTQLWNMNSCFGVTVSELNVLQPTVGTYVGDGVVLDYDCDSIIFRDSTVIGTAAHGWNCIKTAGSTGPRLIRFLNCQSESNTLDGFLVTAGRDVRFSGCHAAVNGGNGYTVAGGDSIVIHSSLALQNSLHGIILLGGTGIGILDNTCSNNSQQTHNTSSGIYVETPVDHVRITGNRSGDFILSLGNKQKYGLFLNGGTDFLKVWGNELDGNQSGSLQNGSTGVNNLVIDGTALQQMGARITTLTDAATILVDHSLGPEYQVTLGGNRTMGAPSNVVVGKRITFVIIQDGTGGRTLAWNAAYKVTWSDAGNTLGKRSTISFVPMGDGFFSQDGAQTAYV